MWPGRGPRTGPQDRAVAIFGWDYSIEADPAPGAPGTLSPASSWNSVLGEGCCVDRPQGPNGLMPEDLSERPGLGRTGGGAEAEEEAPPHMCPTASRAHPRSQTTVSHSSEALT